MKKYFFLIFILLATTYSYATKKFSGSDPKTEQLFILLPGTDIHISLADYLKLKPSDFKKLTGEKLKLIDVIYLKINQKRLKKAIRKDGSIDALALERIAKEPFKWHWGGFFLGLLLPVAGLIITFFIKDEHRKNRILSATIGTSFALSIGLLIAVIIAVTNF
jgi:hypothetical protein